LTNPVAEEEKNTSSVTMRRDILESIAKGYLSELKHVITEIDIDNMVYGAELITNEQANRFLTDYFNGDVYYYTAYNIHNLVRPEISFLCLRVF